jgi:PelA/Pel-15E family pectate lyase
MISRPLFAALFLSTALLTAPAFAEVIGHNVPALPLTAERVATLPEADRGAWTDYLKTSAALQAADKAALAAEQKGLTTVPKPSPHGDSAKSMPLDKPADWYSTSEARAVADTIVSFQTPAGGWGKNMLRNVPVRQRGQSYTGDNISASPKPDDNAASDKGSWDYVGTFDNGATTTELRFLARVAEALPGAEGDVYRKAALRGLEYMLTAQFPNGGWPQVFPLQGGYHDAITYNDDALGDVTEVLTFAAEGREGFGFVSQALRDRARTAVDRAVECILVTQVRINGKLTVWGQQHDALSLEPTSARNYEPPSFSSAESAGLLVYLMQIKDPSPRVVASVHAGVAWLKDAALHDVAWVKIPDDRVLQPQPGAPLLWSRYYDFKTGKPIFGDRDKTIHDTVTEISQERRRGYSWYNSTPQKALDAYVKWSQTHQQ